MFKDKILAELRKKYPGLPANVLGQLAEKLGTTVTEESQIETAVADLEKLPIPPAELAKIVQTEGDRRVTEALKKQQPPKNQPPKDEPPKDDDPLAALLKTVNQLNDKLEKLEKEKSTASVTEQLHAKLKEKKIPTQLAKGVTIESVDELDNAVAQIEADWTAIKQDQTNLGLIGGLPKPGGVGTPGVVEQKKEAVEADIKAWAQKGAPQKA